ncbi:MAG: type II toxin-antitoxin system PemK/MazF family toxin [Candidatus Gracilibacteria bacterium]
MVVSQYIPDRGDIIWIDFDPQAGREQSGRRPALVLSHKKYNERAELVILCPITSKAKSYPFVVHLPEDLLSKPSYVLSDQVKSVDWIRRNATFLAKAPASSLEVVTLFAVGIIKGMC